MKSLWVGFIFCLFVTPLFAQSGNTEFRVYKIWDKAEHNAFTDLKKYRGKFYCTFREGGGHVPWPSGLDGKIRILESKDGETWESVALLEKNDFDLRDSKLSVDAKDRLMVLMGGSNYNNDTRELICRLTQVSFFDTLRNTFSDPVPTRIDPAIKSDYDWLWRVTWHKNTGYGVLYRKKDSSKSELFLLKTVNGIDYDLIVQLPMKDVAGESTVTFDREDNMIIIVRVDSGTRMGLIAKSSFPYTDWDFKETGIRLGGPNIIPYKNDWYFIGTRSFNFRNQAKTAIYLYREGDELRSVVELPSGGDNSYPGMVIEGNELWVSYYSSHEGKTSVYMAKIPLSYAGNIGSKN